MSITNTQPDEIIKGGTGAGEKLVANLEKIESEYGSESELTYEFSDKLLDIYNNGLSEILDIEICNFLKNKIWGIEEFGEDVQPWRENGYIFRSNGIVKVVHGRKGQVPFQWFIDNLVSNPEEGILLFGHSHDYLVRLGRGYDNIRGSFVRYFLENWLVCDCGNPSGEDFRLIGGDIEPFIDSKIHNIVVGEQFITFFKGNTTDVYDIDSGKRVASNISYTEDAMPEKGKFIETKKLFVEGLSAVCLEEDGECIYYDIFGNKTGGTGGAQKELRKVSGGIKVSSQGYVSLEY